MENTEINLTERAKQLAAELPTLSMDDEKETLEIIHRHLTAITRDMAGKVKELDRQWHEAKADALTQREMAQIYGEQRDELTIENANLRAELEAIKKAGEKPTSAWRRNRDEQ